MPLSDRDKRTLKIGGVIAVVLVAAFLGIGQLGKGPSPGLPVPSGTSLPTGAPSASTGPSSTASTGVPTGAPSSSQVFAGRDPFSVPPILQTSTATPSGSSTSTSSGSTTPPPTGTGSPTATPTNAPTNGSSTVVGGHTVVLLDTFSQGGTEMADVEVDGTVYHPAVGGHFAGGDFQLLAVSGDCATILFGDESFTLCFTPSK